MISGVCVCVCVCVRVGGWGGGGTVYPKGGQRVLGWDAWGDTVSGGGDTVSGGTRYPSYTGTLNGTMNFTRINMCTSK